MPDTPGGPRPLDAVDTRQREDYILNQPPRLAPLTAETAPEESRKLIDEMGTIVVDGEVRERTDMDSVAVMARHPDIYRAHLAMSGQFLASGTLTVRDRELAVLRTAWLSQAPFEWGGHVPIAKRNDITSEEIERVIEGSAAPAWHRRDRAIIRAAEDLHYDSMIADETWQMLAEHLDDKQLIELVMLVGQYKTVAYYQNSLRLPLGKGNDGLAAR